MKTTKFTTKLGKSKGNARSRIWLQGARLIDAGFKPGLAYGATWTSDTLKLELSIKDGQIEQRRVTGTTRGPVIDIVGAHVVQVFGIVCDRVDVTFKAGVITINRHRADERPEGA